MRICFISRLSALHHGIILLHNALSRGSNGPERIRNFLFFLRWYVIGRFTYHALRLGGQHIGFRRFIVGIIALFSLVLGCRLYALVLS